MSRVGEVALGIIGSILNAIFLIIVTLAVMGVSSADSAEIQMYFEEQMIITDPTMTSEDMLMFNDIVSVGLNIFGIVGWVFVGTLLISLILSIVGVFKVSKNKSPKTAGVLFIFAAMLSGIILLAPILFYIAAIMCFARKTTDHHLEETFYNNDRQQTDQSHQPL